MGVQGAEPCVELAPEIRQVIGQPPNERSRRASGSGEVLQFSTPRERAPSRESACMQAPCKAGSSENASGTKRDHVTPPALPLAEAPGYVARVGNGLPSNAGYVSGRRDRSTPPALPLAPKEGVDYGSRTAVPAPLPLQAKEGGTCASLWLLGNAKSASEVSAPPLSGGALGAYLSGSGGRGLDVSRNAISAEEQDFASREHGFVPTPRKDHSSNGLAFVGTSIIDARPVPVGALQVAGTGRRSRSVNVHRRQSLEGGPLRSRSRNQAAPRASLPDSGTWKSVPIKTFTLDGLG